MPVTAPNHPTREHRRTLSDSTVRAAIFLTLGVASATLGQGDRAPLEVWYGAIDPPVVAQRDVTIREMTSIHPLDPEPQPLEISGMITVVDRIILTSDRHSHVVFSLAVDLQSSAVMIGLPEPTRLVDTERRLIDDAECITTRRRASGEHEGLIFCSLSNDPGGERRFKRQHIARFTVLPDGRITTDRVQVMSADSVRDALASHFDALGVSPYVSFDSERNANTLRWGNVEGIAWTPDGATLLCAMRSPMADGDAIFFALSGVSAAFDSDDPTQMRVIDLFRLNLGGRGASDLAWDAVSGGYLITAALSNGPKTDPNQIYPLENLDAALFWWSGDKSKQPVLVAKFPDLNVEAVTRIGDGPYIALGSDEGDVSEGRRGRQSALTIMHFLGPASEEAEDG